MCDIFGYGSLAYTSPITENEFKRLKEEALIEHINPKDLCDVDGIWLLRYFQQKLNPENILESLNKLSRKTEQGNMMFIDSDSGKILLNIDFNPVAKKWEVD